MQNASDCASCSGRKISPLPFPRARTSAWNKPVPVLTSQSSLERLCGCSALGAAWTLGSIRQVKRGVFQGVFQCISLSCLQLSWFGWEMQCSAASLKELRQQQRCGRAARAWSFLASALQTELTQFWKLRNCQHFG